MDFVSYIRDQAEKLNYRDYVNHLWEELEGRDTDTEIDPSIISDYNNHLPLLLEQFWEIALEKLNESLSLDEFDEDLRKYLLVLIYQCLTQSHELISYKCVLYASEIYLNLLATAQSDDFYKSKLYCATLNTLQSSLEAASSERVTNRLMYKLRCFLTKAKFDVNDLEVTLATLIQIIFVKSQETFDSFDEEANPGSISYEAFLGLKVLLEQENNQSRKFLITTYLFNGLRKHQTMHFTPRHMNIIQVNFRNLLKSLHQKFKEDHYKTFLNAFIHTWKHPDFTFYGEAVIIMNNLKEKHYQTVLDILNKMIMTKTSHKNLFKLSLAIICLPTKHASVEKIKVTNEILLRNIILNCISSKSDISNAAVESLAEILLSPDLDKDYIKIPVKAILNRGSGQILSVVTILRGLQGLMTKKWSGRSKNKHLFAITVSVMSLSEEDHPEVYRQILEFLTDECSPFDLKPFLSLLSETYIKLTEKNFKYSAHQLLKIIFKMALHPMASSTEFVKYLYMAMAYPNVCKGVAPKSEIFIDPIISDDFNFPEFFQKCRTLGLIKITHNFDDLIRYMFKQLVYGDTVFKKTCLTKIDRLIRDDYLKLDLEQFLVFMTILGDRNVVLSDYLKHLLSESFFMSNTTLIARYFVPLIVHINGYRRHPNYKISNSGFELIELMSRDILDRRKIYTLLFTSLPIKNRFGIIYVLATHILENMMKGVIKMDEGFWKMIKDSIFIFKLMTSNSSEDDSDENYYKKILGHISKYILQETEYSEKSLHTEYHKEITQGTETLLKLLFFNDSDNIQKYISISVFDALVHWTHFLIADLVHIVHSERNKTIRNYYLKLEKFYKKNEHSLRYAEESFETGGRCSSDSNSCTGPLFNVSESYIPPFENN